MVWRCNKNRKDCMNLFNGKDFILFDTETTGLHPEKGDRIIEIAAMKLRAVGNDLGIVEKFHLFIRPPFPVSDIITEITGITNQFLADKPLEESIFPKVFAFFGNHPILCAYNTPFDVGMMKAMYARNRQVFEPALAADVLEMVRDIIPVSNVENFKQETIVRLYGLEQGLTFHHADDDIMAAARLLKTIHMEYLAHPEENGLVRPKLEKCWFFEGYNRKQRALYVQGADGGEYRFIYNQYQRGWLVQGYDIKNIDMEYVQRTVLSRLGLEDIIDIQKLTKKKMDEIWRNWYRKAG